MLSDCERMRMGLTAWPNAAWVTLSKVRGEDSKRQEFHLFARTRDGEFVANVVASSLPRLRRKLQRMSARSRKSEYAGSLFSNAQ